VKERKVWKAEKVNKRKVWKAKKERESEEGKRNVWKAKKVKEREEFKQRKKRRKEKSSSKERREREREKEKREKKKKNLCFKGEHEPREETVFGAVHGRGSAVASLEDVAVREAWSCRCTVAVDVEWAVGVSSPRLTKSFFVTFVPPADSRFDGGGACAVWPAKRVRQERRARRDKTKKNQGAENTVWFCEACEL